MKNKILLLVSIVILAGSALKAQLNVGSTQPADPSAILQATSTTKGFLPPSMTTSARNAIVNPANGLLIFNTDKQQVEVFSNISGSPAWGIASANIYNKNGILTAARTIDQAGNLLSFKNGPVTIDSSLLVDVSGSFGGVVTPTAGALLRFGPINQSTEGIGSARSIGSANQNGLDFYTGGLSKLSITSIGNVGVGTQAPQAGLDVAANLRIGTTVSGDIADSILTINSTTGIVNRRSVASINANVATIYNADGTLNNARTITQASNPLNFKGGTVNIDSSLSVDASGSFGGLVTPTAGAILRFGAVNQSTEGIGSTRSSGSANQNGLDFYIGGISKLSITSGGNVGIGTQTPAAGLDVANNLRLGITVSGATTDSILTINSTTGIVNKRSVTSVVRQNTDSSIYSTNGTLRSVRTIDQANNLLYFKNGLVSIDSSLSVDANGSFGGAVTATTGSILGFGGQNAVSTEGIGSKRTAGGNANGLDFYTGGISKVSIANGGNVGIGTQAPLAKLDVFGNMMLRATAAGALSDYILTLSPTTSKVNTIFISSILTIYTANGTLSAARTITQGGNLLYFKNGPVSIDSSLSVDASGSFGGAVTATTGSILRFGGQSATSTEGIGSKRTAGGNVNGIDFYTAGTSKISIANGGNVGIGTQAPAAGLDVVNNMRLGTTVSGATTDSILTINSSTGIVNKRSIASVVRQNTDSSIYNSNGTLTGACTVTQAGNVLTFTGGNVGIGTLTPAASFDVANNMRLGTTISGATTDSILTINSSTGIVNMRSIASVVRQNTDSSIYCTDGTLRSIRTITQAGNALNFKGGLVNIDSSLSVDASGSFGGAVTATTGAILRFGTASSEGIGSKRTAGGNANGLDFYTAGTSKISIANGGNVGIGTQVPAALLNVAGNMRLGTTASAAITDSILTINNSTGIINKRTVASLNSGALNIYNTDGTLTSARTITQGGNALTFTGGTVHVDQSLTVDGAGTFSGGTLSGTTGSILRFGAKNTSGEGIGSNRVSGANINGLDMYTAGTSKISIANAGNVGIGTQSPTNNLDINGGVRIRTIPGSSSSALLNTDANGNIGQTTIKPNIMGLSGQNGVSSVTFTGTETTFQYTGWTITIPANSQYLVSVQHLMVYNGGGGVSAYRRLLGTFSIT